jgi:hypothetical protein
VEFPDALTDSMAAHAAAKKAFPYSGLLSNSFFVIFPSEIDMI